MGSKPDSTQRADRQAILDILERPPKGIQENYAAPINESVTRVTYEERPGFPVTAKAAPTQAIEKVYHIEEPAKQDFPMEVDNSLASERNQTYITNKLLQHRQNLIDTYGVSKVPTPVMNVIKPMVLSSSTPSESQSSSHP
jgi:hypothetical protein